MHIDSLQTYSIEPFLWLLCIATKIDTMIIKMKYIHQVIINFTMKTPILQYTVKVYADWFDRTLL